MRLEEKRALRRQARLEAAAREQESYSTSRVRQNIGLFLIGLVLGAGSMALAGQVTSPQSPDLSTILSKQVPAEPAEQEPHTENPQPGEPGTPEITMREQAGQVYAEFDLAGTALDTSSIDAINQSIRLGAQQGTSTALEQAREQYPEAEAIHITGLGQVPDESGAFSPPITVVAATYLRSDLDRLTQTGYPVLDHTAVWGHAHRIHVTPQIALPDDLRPEPEPELIPAPQAEVQMQLPPEAEPPYEQVTGP